MNGPGFEPIAEEEMVAVCRGALEFAGIGLYRYRFDGTVLFMDRGAMKILGLQGRFSDPESIAGKNISELLIYEGPPGALRARVRENGHARGMEYPFRTLDGEEKWALHDSYLVSHSEGQEAIQVIVRDITDRKNDELAVARERERLAVTLRSIGDAVITTDVEGRVVLVNRVAESLTGWSQEDAVGKKLEEVFYIVNEKTRVRCENPVQKVLESGRIVGLANHTALISRDGHEYAIADSGAPIRDPSSKVFGVVLVFRDVSEARRIEEDLQRIEKLESLGVLAGGIAHDFNNLLASILGNVSLAKLHTIDGDEVSVLLGQAEAAVMRAKAVTMQLLTFSKGSTPVKAVTDLSAVVQETAEFALSGSRSRGIFSFPADLPAVDVDGGQISRLVHNLVTNADQAMPSGGEIRIACEAVTIGNDSLMPLSPGPYVKLTIADSGIGIHEQYLTRIFDPYFTTKQLGSGLGLAVAHSIVKHHDGHIEVRSTPGEGSVFSVYFPACHTPAQEAWRTTIPPHSGRGRILVMDDEPALRKMAARMVRYLGYEAEVVADGAEALERVARAVEAGRPFDVVLLDLTIPGAMGGLETLDRLREGGHQMGAIASSGYSSDPVMAEYRRYGFTAALAKPYTITELSTVLHRILGEAKVE